MISAVRGLVLESENEDWDPRESGQLWDGTRKSRTAISTPIPNWRARGPLQSFCGPRHGFRKIRGSESAGLEQGFGQHDVAIRGDLFSALPRFAV